jgi:hypothetical protein
MTLSSLRATWGVTVCVCVHACVCACMCDKMLCRYMLWRKGGKKITVIGAEFDEVLFTDVLGLPARRAIRVLWFWHFIAAQEPEHHVNHLVRAVNSC